MCALFNGDIFCRNLLGVMESENYQVRFSFFTLYNDWVLVLVAGLEKFWMQTTFGWLHVFLPLVCTEKVGFQHSLEEVY